jgi:hypothetical protein
MSDQFKLQEWYTHNNGTNKITFQCLAIDGEYLFPTENINGEGFSLLLCQPATKEEISRAKRNAKK